MALMGSMWAWTASSSRRNSRFTAWLPSPAPGPAAGCHAESRHVGVFVGFARCNPSSAHLMSRASAAMH